MKDSVRFKLKEAKFFLSLLEINQASTPERNYYLSAFVTAARSVE